MLVDELVLWLYVYREVWDDEKHVPRFKMGRGDDHFLQFQTTFSKGIHIIFLGSPQDKHCHLVECLGAVGYACRMDGLVLLFHPLA